MVTARLSGARDVGAIEEYAPFWPVLSNGFQRILLWMPRVESKFGA